MDLALAQAERGRGWVEPNPMVGAVIVRQGQLVGRGYHTRFGGPHAELMALQAAGDAAQGATLYVTLEPCCHHGKTPPCTSAILAAGLARVVVAIRDPFPQVDGGGLAVLRSAGVEIALGSRFHAAADLNAPFLKRVFLAIPYVTAKWAMTLDGKTAVASGDSQWISSPRSRALVHQLRGQMDAILVGIGTVLTDDPLLTARPAGPRTPARIVLDGKARLPMTSRLVTSAREVPVLVAVSENAPAERCLALEAQGCSIVSYPGGKGVPLGPLLADLGRREITNLLVEGGGRVLGSFLDGGHVDQVDVYIAPILEGGDHSHVPARGKGVLRMVEATRLRNVVHSEVDGDLRVRGVFDQPWRSRISSLGSETETGESRSAPDLP
jgi:diaminohydroxyphosphoribosylaminopyrimidine deaminase/5-amino-6-(5-phosphoribosylamino)uracil reductase